LLQSSSTQALATVWALVSRAPQTAKAAPSAWRKISWAMGSLENATNPPELEMLACCS
jgi:hypothetical protein